MKTVKLLRVTDQKRIDANLTALSTKHLADVDTFWKDRLEASKEQDRHWDWIQKYLSTATPNYDRYALECECVTQGLMILELDCHRSRIEPKKNLVYLEYLATAPWNRIPLQDPPMYRGVGTALFTAAIECSLDLDYKGRIGLHALPLAESFYRALGAIDFGLDASYFNLRYFELPTNKAVEIMSKCQ